MTSPDAAAGPLEAELDALYAAPPDEFVTARAAAARRLRDVGLRDQGRELAAARKPTAGAALVNLLARAGPDLVADAIDAVEAARTAIETGDGVREALERQRAAVDAAEAPLAALVGEQGASDAVARQAVETLRAAVLDPALQPLLRAGRLVTASRATGFAALPTTPAPRRAAAPPAKPAAKGAAAPARPDRQADAAAARAAKRAAAEHQRQLAAAQRDLQAAERVEAAALRALEKAKREAERSGEARSAAAARLAELERAAP